MSVPITCALCGREVDDDDTVVMPNGNICDDPCYKWLEQMMDEAREEDDLDIDDYRTTEEE